MKKMILVPALAFVLLLGGCDLFTSRTTSTEPSSSTTITTDDTIQSDTTTTTAETTTVANTTTAVNTTAETTMIFVVSFDVRQGSDVNSITVASGSSISLPISEREGYNFLVGHLLILKKLKLSLNHFSEIQVSLCMQNGALINIRFHLTQMEDL